MAGYYYHSSRTGHSSGSNYNAQGGYNSGYSSGSNGSNQGYSSNSGYSNQGYSSAAYSTGNGYNQASNSNYYTYGNNAAAAQTSRNQIYQQYWDVHNRFWGDNGGVQNTTQWGSYWADKTLQNPSASIWQSDGHLNLNAFTSALDNYSNHQYNYNKQGAGNYSGYNSSASIYNQTPDWNNHYGSDVLGQYYQTGYNDQTVQGLNSSWTERQTSPGFQSQHVGATYTEYIAGNNGQTGTYNSYWRSSNPNSANYDNQYTHYDLGRHTVSEYDFLQYDSWADDTSYIDRYVSKGLGSQADAYNYVNNTSLHSVETYFDAQTANDVLLQAYQQDGFSAAEMFANNQGPDVWKYALDEATGNALIAGAYLSKEATELEQSYFDVDEDFANFNPDDFGQTFTDVDGSYHFDAFGNRTEGEAGILARNNAGVISAFDDIENSWVGGALEALGDNRQGAYYAVETASQIYSANVGSSALDNSIHNNTDSSRSLSLSSPSESGQTSRVTFFDTKESLTSAREMDLNSLSVDAGEILERHKRTIDGIPDKWGKIRDDLLGSQHNRNILFWGFSEILRDSQELGLEVTGYIYRDRTTDQYVMVRQPNFDDLDSPDHSNPLAPGRQYQDAAVSLAPDALW